MTDITPETYLNVGLKWGVVVFLSITNQFNDRLPYRPNSVLHSLKLLTGIPLMELIYLILSAISTFFSSMFLSLLLPFRAILRRSSDPLVTADSPVAFYEGVVWHERRRPAHHSFSYPVRYALFDLDHHATNASADHLSASDARRAAGTSGPVSLLTIPPSVGYVQNPLSLYYCYDVEHSTKILKKCIAEVTNTPWGERVSFAFDPSSDLVAKALHVSPFMDMLGHWIIKATSPGDNLWVSIKVQHPDLGGFFSATLRAKRVSSGMVTDQELYFWLMPHKVALWIYWHALKLRWKNVAFIQHPRYTNPAYREEAALRDQKLNCCKGDKVEASGLLFEDDKKVQACRFAWRDAKWPWC